MNHGEVLKTEILEKVREYYNVMFGSQVSFTSGVSRIPYSGRVFDADDMVSLVDSALEFWLTYGRYSELFELELARFLGVRFCSLVNSGSSANLLAFMALTSESLGERRIHRGDEVITVAAGFPTTVAPLINYGAVPVFVDVDLRTLNVHVPALEGALSPRTKAVMLAHTLGNPFNLSAVKAFCDRHNLWLIEDNCDALGSTYQDRYTGTLGDIGTSSFYPPHHITMGEGGAVYTNNPQLAQIINSLRDWGRDCWCSSGKDNTCHKRFGWQLGELPYGYDHKYIYSHFGYNLKATEMQAAIGCTQLQKLPRFIEARRRNFSRLNAGLRHLEPYFIFTEATPNSDPSWFGFSLIVKEDAPFTRDEIVNHLEKRNIQTRMLFAGNLLKHPCFNEMRNKQAGYRVVGQLKNTDLIMRNAFWVGVYPGMTDEMVECMIQEINMFVAE